MHTALDTSGSSAPAPPTAACRHRPGAARHQVLRRRRRTPQVTGGGDVAPTLGFAAPAGQRSAAPVWVRFVLVPGLTDEPENVEPLADFVAALGNVERVDVLPFHTLGAPNTTRSGIPFPLADRPPPTREQAAAARAVFAARGLLVT